MGRSLQTGRGGASDVRADIQADVRAESQLEIISGSGASSPESLGQRSQSNAMVEIRRLYNSLVEDFAFGFTWSGLLGFTITKYH